jgi:hypothetical protein
LQHTVVMIGDRFIDYADIRHVMIHDFRKWSNTEPVTSTPFEMDYLDDMQEEHREQLINTFNDYFNDNNWME